MPTGAAVRDIVASDYGQWLPVWHGCNAFHGRSGPAALPAEVSTTTWRRFFDAGEPGGAW